MNSIFSHMKIENNIFAYTYPPSHLAMPANDEAFDAAFGAALERMNDRIHQSIRGDGGYTAIYISYSAYRTDKKGIPIDNLDEIAVRGRVRFHQKYEPFWDRHDGGGNGQDYMSPYIKNPTWLDVAKFANEMIKVTGDQSHVFLEGISGKKPLFSFEMGS